VGLTSGSTRRKTAASRSMMAAAITYTGRQLPAEAIRPLTMRASIIPMMSPLMTVPTTWPRWASGAIEAAIGTTICATTDVTPAIARALASTAKPGAAAAAASAAAVITSSLVMSRRRSSRSPRGTSSARPRA